MRLIVDGCSFTFGAELEAEDVLPPDHYANVNKLTSEYRIAHIWPSLLGKSIGATEVINLARQGKSVDGIFRTTTKFLANEGNPQTDLVLICPPTPNRFERYNGDVRTNKPHVDGWVQVAVQFKRFNPQYKNYLNEYARWFSYPEGDIERASVHLGSLIMNLKLSGYSYLLWDSFCNMCNYAKEFNLSWEKMKKFTSVMDTSKYLTFDSERFSRGFVNVFEQASPTNADQFYVGLHPNEAGHRVIADHMLKVLEQQDYV